jgi:phenylacetate-CoA ligase
MLTMGSMASDANTAALAGPPFAAVKQEIDFAYRTTRLAREKLDSAGITPAEIGDWEDVLRVPPTTRQEYRAHFPAGVIASGASLADPFVFRSQSSGTDHDRQVSVAHSFTLARRKLTTTTVNPPFFEIMAKPGANHIIRYAAPNCSDVECASPTVTKDDRILSTGALVLPAAHDLMATRQEILDRAIDEIFDWKPVYLSCDAARLAQLIRQCQRRGIETLPGAGVLLTYSQITMHARRTIDGFFAAVAVAELVTMSELGWVAMECPSGSLHLNNEAFWTEIVCDGRPASTDEIGDLYVTTLDDRLSPKIRYVTGDVYRLAHPCACGHAFPTVVFEGRRRDLVRRGKAVVLTPRVVDALVGAPTGLLHYRLHQHREDYCTFRFVVEDGASPDWEEALADRLREGLGRDCRLEVERTSYIPSERSGKFLSCTSTLSVDLERATPGAASLIEARP